MIGKAGNWGAGEAGGGGLGLGDKKPYRYDQEELKMLFPRSLDRQRGLVSREY